MKAMKAQE